MPKIIMYVNTGFVGANHKTSTPLPEEWNDMDEQEREKYLDDCACDYRDNCIDFGAYVEGGDEHNTMS